MRTLPLEGVRVLDLTMVTAGPNATMVLGDLGAEIIKVESARYSDSFRSYGARLFKEDRPYNSSPPFHVLNRNKYGVTIDLNHPLGKDLLKRLVKVSDVVAENFRAGVMARLGLDYEVLKEVKSDIIMISIGSQGSEGPEANYGSYGLVLDALSGLAALTGYEGGMPTWTAGVNYPDQVASMFALGLTLAALRHRRRTGLGGYVDLSQREFTTNLVGEELLDYTVNGHTPELKGNRHRSMAPHGCYPTQGDDMWVTIAVASDEEWRALCGVLGRSDLANDPRFADVVARKHHEKELDAIVAEWTSPRDREAITAQLQSAGVAAGPVYNGKDLLGNPHLKEREFVHYVDVPRLGLFPHKSVAPKWSRFKPTVRKLAPGLGEDNDFIFRERLGLSDAELEELRRERVIDDAPQGAQAWQVP